MYNNCVERGCLQLLDASYVLDGIALLTVANTVLEHGKIYALRYNVDWCGASGPETLYIANGTITPDNQNPTRYPVIGPKTEPVTIGQITQGGEHRREVIYLQYCNPTSPALVIPPHFRFVGRTCPQAVRATPMVAVAVPTQQNTPVLGPT
jgi:hypothetical protein